MPARSIGSSAVSLGLVTIHVKLFSTVKEDKASFNQLHAACGTRVKQQLVCPTHDNTPVEHSETVKGFEVSPGTYVQFTAKELADLEAERNDAIVIDAFVPRAELDALRIDKSNYVGPDKGAEKGYKLLRLEMEHAGLVAVGRQTARGKTRPVVLEPHDAVIVLHQLHYDAEVLSYADIDLGSATVGNGELRLMRQLVAQLKTDKLDSSAYRDEYSERVRAAAAEKAASGQVTTSPEQPVAPVFDLVEALKRSLEAAPKLKGTVKKTASEKPARRRRAS